MARTNCGRDISLPVRLSWNRVLRPVEDSRVTVTRLLGISCPPFFWKKGGAADHKSPLMVQLVVNQKTESPEPIGRGIHHFSGILVAIIPDKNVMLACRGRFYMIH